jgi:hypothetical protein
MAEKHNSETRNDQVGCEIFERELGSIPEETGRVAELAQAFCCEREHWARDINSYSASGGANEACDFDGRGAAPATDIDHRRPHARRGKFG